MYKDVGQKCPGFVQKGVNIGRKVQLFDYPIIIRRQLTKSKDDIKENDRHEDNDIQQNEFNDRVVGL